MKVLIDKITAIFQFIFDKVKVFLPVALFVFICIAIVESIFLLCVLVAPVGWFVDYIEIEPLSDVNTIGYNIPMRTHVYPKTDVHVKYNDILRCSKEVTKQGTKVVWKEKGNQATKHASLKKSDGPYWGDWDMAAASIWLNYPDKCVIESNTLIRVWGIEKALKPHYTKPFYMVENPNDTDKVTTKE